MSADTPDASNQTGPEEGQQQEGQVSDAENLDPADAETPIAPDQATAGYPDSESGDPDEGPAGPNARIGDADQA